MTLKTRIPKKIWLWAFAAIVLTGFALPENIAIPVQDATSSDWNHDSFWYEPWGSSGVHKGIDIFSAMSTPVVASTYGLVLYQGQLTKGGNVIVILGPKWRIHYYAHLEHINVRTGAYVSATEIIGSLGDSGNAQGKPPHLHYSIVSIMPYIWRVDTSTQGWKKMFFLDPSERLLAANS